MSPTFSPISLGGIGKAVINSTTGSPTVNNNARAGKTIYQFNGSGSITVGTAGTVEALIVGGGGGGGGTGPGNGAGGGGGYAYFPSVVLPSGTHTITVGSGASLGGNQGPSAQGNPSAISFDTSSGTNTGLVAFGGGGGGISNVSYAVQTRGGSGGGASPTSGPALTGANGFLNQGSRGGNANLGPGGGGGASNVGGDGNTSNGGNGGNGATTNINGSSVTYAGGGGALNNGTGGTGGGGNANNSGAANTGGGGGSIGAGGSGIVIVVVG